MLPYSPWLSWLIPFLGSFSTPLLDKISRKVLHWTPFILVFISSIFTFSMLPDIYNHVSMDISMKWIPFLNLSFGVLVDSLSVFMASVVSFIGALILLYSIGYMAEEESLSRYYFFMLLFIGAMIGLVMADNLIQLYIFWELVGLCSYALIGFWYKKPEAVRAGMKAFMVTRFGDLCLLAGILLLYLNTDTFNFLTLKDQVTVGLLDASLITTLAILLFGGAIGKSAQVPLFVWLPDAMEGPTTVSALIHAATMVKAGVYLMARTVMVLTVTPEYSLMVATVGAITAFMAATMALASFDIKRVLAYSTISQLGYMFIALGIPTEEGWLASQFHLMNHALFKALLFLCAGVLIHMLGTRDMRQMGGLAKRTRITFLAFLIGGFSLSSVPPFNGFWSKEMILEISYRLNGQMGLAISILGTITAAITFAYTIRMIGLVFLGEESTVKAERTREVPKVMIFPLIVLAVACIISGFLQTQFMHLFHAEKSGLTINPISLSWSLLALILGGLPAYLIYIKRSIPPEKITENPVLKIIHKILTNGYYFDSFYNFIFIKGTTLASNKVRKFQTGILNVNMLAFLAGLICLLFFAIQGGML